MSHVAGQKQKTNKKTPLSSLRLPLLQTSVTNVRPPGYHITVSLGFPRPRPAPSFDNLLAQFTELSKTVYLTMVYHRGYNSGTPTWRRHVGHGRRARCLQAHHPSSSSVCSPTRKTLNYIVYLHFMEV